MFGINYGEKVKISEENALNSIIQSLQEMAYKTNVLLFQLGFNWKDDRDKPLFDKGTKAELIEFICENLYSYFDFTRIVVAEMVHGEVRYTDVNEKISFVVTNLVNF